MPGNLTPAQDYDHLVAAKSGSDGMHDLQFKAEIDTGQTWNRGALVCLTAGGKLTKGGGDAKMPLWAINSTSDFDVDGDVGNFIGNQVACWVATGGYELFTTEYVTTGNYLPNQLLTNATAGDLGKIKPSASAYNLTNIVGCVSSGVASDVYNQSVLNFWPMFIPKYKVT